MRVHAYDSHTLAHAVLSVWNAIKFGIPSEGYLETRIEMQVIYSEGDPRSTGWGADKKEKGRKPINDAFTN